MTGTGTGGPGPDRAPPEGGTTRIRVEVPALLDGVRADRAVAMLTGVSRSAASSLVASGRVLLDGASLGSGRLPLAEGALLEVELPPPEPAVTAEPDVPVVVVHADDQVIVVDKPAGLVVHPGAGQRRGTLVAGLLARFPDLASLAGVSGAERPGIVQRLDRGTSGLLVVARTEGAYRSLVAQLAARSVERRYVALVRGEVRGARGVVEAPIGRSARVPTRMAVSAQGRPARSSYTVRERLAGPVPATLLDLSLETGRTHQIRVHLAAIGHPVVGDDRYGRAGDRAGDPAGGLAPGRLFLHAARLGFDHPGSGERCRFESPLPGDLAAVLAAGRGPGG